MIEGNICYIRADSKNFSLGIVVNATTVASGNSEYPSRTYYGVNIKGGMHGMGGKVITNKTPKLFKRQKRMGTVFGLPTKKLFKSLGPFQVSVNHIRTPDDFLGKNFCFNRSLTGSS
jgi:hypothetical protein